MPFVSATMAPKEEKKSEKGRHAPKVSHEGKKGRTKVFRDETVKQIALQLNSGTEKKRKTLKL